MVATVLDMCAVLKLCCVFGCRLLHSLGSFVPACVIDSISDFRTVPCLACAFLLAENCSSVNVCGGHLLIRLLTRGVPLKCEWFDALSWMLI